MQDKIQNLSTFKTEASFSGVLGRMNELENCFWWASGLMEHNLEDKNAVLYYLLPGLKVIIKRFLGSHKTVRRLLDEMNFFIHSLSRFLIAVEDFLHAQPPSCIELSTVP